MAASVEIEFKKNRNETFYFYFLFFAPHGGTRRSPFEALSLLLRADEVDDGVDLGVVERGDGRHVAEVPVVLPGAVEAGTAFPIGRALLSTHLFAFEFIALLLVAAIVGAVYLGKGEEE